MKNIQKSVLRILAVCGLICTLAMPNEANAQLFAKKPVVYPTKKVQVNVQSAPVGARVYLNGKLICAATPNFITIPCTATVMPGKKTERQLAIQRSIDASKVKLLFKMDGYMPLEYDYEPEITCDAKGNFTVEWPTSIIVEMMKEPTANTENKRSAEQDAAVASSEINNRVSREKAGQTDLERTILRWYFESEPKGARVFWRVISSCPAEVKNTNESYLGTTPYEDTRSFAIPGLTYENSRDVQIEIKVTRKGYLDMVKRFNVRQAIDQMEISSFFDMVAAE